jgi:hypothetical protein
VVAIGVSPPSATLSIGCGVVHAKGPVKLRATKKGTKVTAHWLDCGGLSGAVHLKGMIADGCGLLSATLRARGVKAKVTAARSRCGDGFHDDVQEACDANDACGDGLPCASDCTCDTSAPTSSTTTSTTSTTLTTDTGSTTTTTSTTSTTTTTFPGTCNPVAAPGAQGCPGGQKCTWIHIQETPEPLGQLGCVPDGVVAADGACSYGPPGPSTGFDDCAAGLICIGPTCKDVCGFDASPGAACATGFDCTRYADVFSNGEDEPVAGACIPSCNPLTQQQGNGDPCPLGQGCYLLTSLTGTAGVCAGAGTVGHGEAIMGSAFANSCLPGLAPRRQDQATSVVECGALCWPTDVYDGVAESYEGGVDPYTCEAKGAAAPDDPMDGEGCFYWWTREVVDFVTPYSNTVGWCFRRAAFQYDSNNDSVPDAPYPRCVDVTTGDVLPPMNGTGDALFFGCVALEEAPLVAPAPARVHLDRATEHP